jgi:phage terminase small subunit
MRVDYRPSNFPITKEATVAKANRLTQKQRLMVEAYMRLGDKTAAYREGYKATCSQASARVRACETFAMPHVAAYLAELQGAAADRTILDQREALQILTGVARGRLSAYLTEDGRVDLARVAEAGGPDVESLSLTDSESSSSVRLKVRDPIKAIERISRMLGWDKPTQIEAGGVVFNLQMGDS